MSSALEARKMKQGVDDLNGLPAPCSLLPARTRWGVYLLLIAIAVGNMTGRLLSVNSVDKVQLEVAKLREASGSPAEAIDQRRRDGRAIGIPDGGSRKQRLRNELRLQRPFLSANDRSRWMTIRSLVEHGTYEIDAIVGQPTWDTIDMVQHKGRDGKLHLYSSKPPLLATLLAGEYWLIHQFGGATLRDYPYEIGRAMLMTVNILPMALMFVLLARLVERVWNDRLGTNLRRLCGHARNDAQHVCGRAEQPHGGGGQRGGGVVRGGSHCGRRRTAAEIFRAGRFCGRLHRGRRLARSDAGRVPWALVAMACTAANIDCVCAGAAVVVAAFFATNWIAHESLRPPYMHRSETDPNDNWYKYTYTVNGREVKSYWYDRQGIDKGEPSKLTYAFHVLVGHHGIFSLTPIWLLSVAGMWMWLRSPDAVRRDLAIGIAAMTLICLVFYIGFRPLEIATTAA